MILANLKTNERGYYGFLRTATVRAPIQIVKADERKNEQSPTHSVLLGGKQVGAGWQKTSKAGRSYLSVKIEDPAFAHTLNAAVVSSADEDAHRLVWSR
jgi:uncharacterized protein (DUF736 family)